MSAIRLDILTSVTVVASTGTVISPNPNVFLLQSYEGQQFVFTGTDIFLTVSPVPSLFEFEPNTTSTAQTFTFKNEGAKTLTISTITFSDNDVTPFTQFLSPYNSFPINLTTGSQGTFTLYYSAVEQGTYFNEVNMQIIDADDYVFLTEQRVASLFVLDFEPTSVVTTVTDVGSYDDTDFSFTGIGLSIDSFTATIVGSSTYSIISSEYDIDSASVTVRFDSIDFPVGTFTTSTATLNVTANLETVEIPLTTVVQFSTASNQNLVVWSGPIALDNAYVAISYDIIGGSRYLTIGVGSGGNGSPEIVDEGILYLDTADIGITGGNMVNSYINWLEVYRIPITAEQTYRSADYLVKSKNADDLTESYGYYFGTGIGQGSMFIVEHDGSNNLSVKINSIREYKGDESFDRTLTNLQDIFYYYATNDRLFNLESVFDEDQTHYFVGINSDGSIVTSIVQHP